MIIKRRRKNILPVIFVCPLPRLLAEISSSIALLILFSSCVLGWKYLSLGNCPSKLLLSQTERFFALAI